MCLPRDNKARRWGCLTRCRAAADGVTGWGGVSVRRVSHVAQTALRGELRTEIREGGEAISHRERNPVYRRTSLWLKFIN